MKFIVHRDFREYTHKPEWVSLVDNDLSKSKWKRFHTKSHYLDSTYPNDWRIVVTSHNQILSDVETILLLQQSFEKYFSNQEAVESLLERIEIPQNSNYNKKPKRDSISLFTKDLLFKALLSFLESSNHTVIEEQVQEFLDNSVDFTYTIPVSDSTFIITTPKQKTPWLENSIESFFRNNLLIQVKRTTLESKGFGIAVFLRKDLKLGKGKSGAQLSHGAVSLVHQPIFKTSFHEEFLRSDDKNILVFTVKDLKDIKEIEHLCLSQKVNHSVITDAGHTQIAPGTITTIAVGPIPLVWLQILAYNVEAIDLNF